MKSAEVNKCIECLNTLASGLSVKCGDIDGLDVDSPVFDSVKFWFPPDLSWWDWLVKYKVDSRICGEDCYTIRVASKAFVENDYPFQIKITAAETVKTVAEFKERLLQALDLLTKAREQKAAHLVKWKKEQIKKAAEGFAL